MNDDDDDDDDYLLAEVVRLDELIP